MGPMGKQVCQNDSLLGRTTEEDCTDLVLEGLMSPAWNFSRMWQLIPSFRENTWLPDCPSTRSHLLVSQVLSPGPRSALTCGFAETSNSLDFKTSLSSLGLCLFMGWATAEIQTSHSYLDLYKNAFYATQLDINPHRDFCQNSPINGHRPSSWASTDRTQVPNAIHFLSHLW